MLDYFDMKQDKRKGGKKKNYKIQDSGLQEFYMFQEVPEAFQPLFQNCICLFVYCKLFVAAIARKLTLIIERNFVGIGGR